MVNQGERIAVLETKVDAIQEDTTDIKKLQAEMNQSLAEHMRRTSLLEQEQERGRKNFYIVVGVALLIQLLANGGPDAVVKLLPLITKLFGL